MCRLVNFYRGEATDSEGRFLKDLWDWADDELEAVHDFIQWMFPLPEPSQFNPDAPLLSEEDIAAFRSDPLLQTNLRKSFERFLAFLGLLLTANGQVVDSPNLMARARDIWSYPNHNWLRITRVLRSLRLLGLEAEALAFYDRLKTFFDHRKFAITTDTFQYWTEAAHGLPFHA